jgi:hypothetical protein
MVPAMSKDLHQKISPGNSGRKFFIDGKIVIAESGTVIGCAIRNISADGAFVIVATTDEVPDRCELAVPSSNSCTPARIVGRSREGIEILFTGPSRPLKEEPAQVGPDSGGDAGGPVRAATAAVVLEGAMGFDKSKIRPGFSLAFTPDPVQPAKGWCKIGVTIRNSGDIIAHQPFLCLPLLGLRMEPAEGWQAHDVTAVRKMRRFSRPSLHDLAPGDGGHCCNILLPFVAEEGGILEYEAGRRHALRELPDLRLTCIVGAGNYPSDRVPLVVPATEIRRSIEDARERREIPQSGRMGAVAREKSFG